MINTAIINDGELVIPNVFSDLNDGGSHIVQVKVDIEAVREQLRNTDAPQKIATKPTKKVVKKPMKKPRPDLDLNTLRHGVTDELAAFDDGELSEMLKAYMNEDQTSTQISLENL